MASIDPSPGVPAAIPANSPFSNGMFAVPTNPFRRDHARADEPAASPDDAVAATYTYTLVKSGPDVRDDEVELADVPSVEVMILWGTQVLHVEHLTPPRDYHVGEEQRENLPSDYFIPIEKLGVTRMPLITTDGDRVSVVIPSGATGSVEVAGGAKTSLDDARRDADPCPALAGARQLPMSVGGRARIEMGDITFVVGLVHAGKPTRRKLLASLDHVVAAYFGASLLAHAGLMGAMALFTPPLGLDDDEGVDKNQLYLIQQYLDAAAERERETPETEQAVDQHADASEGGSGARSTGSEGAMGSQQSHAKNKHYAIRGPAENVDPHVARERAKQEAMTFGLVGLLVGDPDAPTAPWGRDTALGNDALSAQGVMWSDDLGESFGGGGLGLTGIGEGGGGRHEGIGLGPIGTIGRGAGTGDGGGFGPGHARPRGVHKPTVPSMRIGQTIASGHLPPEAIQRVVRQNFGRFRQCYEQGLAKNPNLEGRVTVRFVIDRGGSVSNVGNGGSDLPDTGVVSCVIRTYYGLSFPAPDSGIVTVQYPIMFSPG